MTNAFVSDIKFCPDKEIDKVLTMKVSACDYIKDHLNIIVAGATSSSKTYYISTLDNETCKKLSTLIYKTSRFIIRIGPSTK